MEERRPAAASRSNSQETASSSGSKLQRRISVSSDVTQFDDDGDDIASYVGDTASTGGRLRQRKSRPRTAMGVTIGKPLTVLAEATPGPQYVIKDDFIRPKSAAYSIKSPYKFRANRHPGPDKYDTAGDMMFKTRGERPKSVALTRKGTTAPYHPHHGYHIRDDPGAGHYRLHYTDTGKHAPKTTFGIRHKDGIHAGLVNRTIPPTDTHGFDTPGPSYWPADEVGPEYTFGTAKIYSYESYGQGPFQEDIGDGRCLPTGVEHVLAGRLDKSMELSDTPGPSSYTIPTDMGTGLAKSLSSRHKKLTSFNNPEPCAYDPQRVHHPPAHSMTYREFETSSEPTPAPCDYNPNLPSFDCFAEQPKHAVRNHCRPVYPDILHYPKLGLMIDNPSPNKHNNIRQFSSNDQPSYSLSGRHKQPKHNVPAPNAHPYEHSTPVQPHKRSTASYTISTLQRMPSNRRGYAPRGTNEEGPGPDTYTPKDTSCRPNGTSKSFGIKHRHEDNSSTGNIAPGPKYSLSTGTTHRGTNRGQSATFKGRQSNYMYRGKQPRTVSAMV